MKKVRAGVHRSMRIVLHEGPLPVLEVLLVAGPEDTVVASSQDRDFQPNLMLVSLLLSAFQIAGLSSRMREMLDEHIDPLIAQADGELGSWSGSLVGRLDPSKN